MFQSDVMALKLFAVECLPTVRQALQLTASSYHNTSGHSRKSNSKNQN